MTQRQAVLSSEPLAKYVPYGQNCTSHTGPVCPLKIATQWDFRMFQSLIVES